MDLVQDDLEAIAEFCHSRDLTRLPHLSPTVQTLLRSEVQRLLDLEEKDQPEGNLPFAHLVRRELVTLEKAKKSRVNRILPLLKYRNSPKPAQQSIYRRLISILKVYGLNEKVLERVQLRASGARNDYQVYPFLREEQKAEDPWDRVGVRSNQMQKILGPFSFPKTRYLDYGCNDGKIAFGVGQRLGFVPDHIYGCDLLPSFKIIPEMRDRYTRLVSGETVLPYPEKHFGLITVIMVLHHLPQMEETVRELFRITAPGGLVVIREHHLDPTISHDLRRLLDLTHDLFVFVWNSSSEEFTPEEETQADYQTYQYFENLFRHVGFRKLFHPTQIANFKDPQRNPQNKFWRVFARP